MDRRVGRRGFARRGGQSIVEYMLAVSVLVIGLAAAWTVFAEGVSGGFDTVRRTVQQPYP